MSRRIAFGEAGKIRLGCLVTLLLLAGAAYVGIDYFRVQFRYYKISDAVREKASFASVMDDGTIRRQLAAQADSLGIPLGLRDWSIRRTLNPRYIVIQGQYADSFTVDLPGVHKVFRFTFTPKASTPF